MSQPFFGIDTLMDSEDLMSWLLLNPEIDSLANTYATLTNTVGGMLPNTLNNNGTFDFSMYNETIPPNQPVPQVAPQIPFQQPQPNQIPMTLPNEFVSQYQFGGQYVFPGIESAPTQNLNATYGNNAASASSSTLNSAQRRGSFDTVDTASNQGLPGNAGFTQGSVTGGSKKMPPQIMKPPASVTVSTMSTNPLTPVTAAGASAASKKRPRESIEDLENRVKELRAENEDLHTHYLNVTQRTTEVQKQRAEMEKMMDIKLTEIGDRNDGDQSELAKIVKQYTDLYADYGKCRQREVSFHLQQLEKLVVPTMTTKMCLWTLHQDPSFYQKNRSPMFDILCKELELTPEQIEKILEKRERTSILLGKLRECLDLIESLKTAIEKKHKCYDNICGRVQLAATPKQVVIFLRWISKNANVLAKHIQGGFSRSIQHVPNVEFVHSITKQFITTTTTATGFTGVSSSTAKE